MTSPSMVTNVDENEYNLLLNINKNQGMLNRKKKKIQKKRKTSEEDFLQ